MLELTTYWFQPGATPRNKLSNKNIKYELARYILSLHVFRTCVLYPFTFLEPKFNLRLCSHLCVSRLRRISLKHRKKEVRKSERHVSLKRGARESVHPSARWSLFTMAMLIPRVFSDIDPNFTISMRSTNFSFFFPSFLSLEPLVVCAVFLGTVARSHLSSWSFVDRSSERKQGSGGSVTMEFGNGLVLSHESGGGTKSYKRFPKYCVNRLGCVPAENLG